MFSPEIDRFLLQLVLSLPWIILGFSFHEYCHAWMSRRFGDPLPEREGRLTLNPIKHIDPFGLLALIIFRFGWAKPVQINPRFYRNPQKDTMWVSLAGPVGNFILAIVIVLLMRIMFLLHIQYSFNGLVIECLYEGVYIMLALGFFNLLPIPPLDGSKILRYFLRGSIGYYFDRLEPYGFIILILLVFLGGFTSFLAQFISITRSLLLIGL